MSAEFRVTDALDQATAYDGFSKQRPRRALTPLERDVLCRIISDVYREVAKHNSADLMFDCGEHGIRLDADEVPMLLNIYNAINPRPDDRYVPKKEHAS